MLSSKAANSQLDITAGLTKWRVFVAIAESGSITRAALYLGSNQSLLSRQLNALERECKARLFLRTGRGMQLSEFAQRILPQVKTLLADAKLLEETIQGRSPLPAGLVTLGLLPSTAQPLIHHLFERIRSQFPEIKIKLTEGSSGQVDQWLTDGRIDIAILYRYGATLPVSERSLAMVDTYLIGAAGDALTDKQEVCFSALDRLPFVLPGAPNGLRNALETIGRLERVSITTEIEAESLPLMKSLVAEAKIYTLLPLHAVWREVQDGSLQAAKVTNPALQRHISMVLPNKSNGPSRAVSTVADLIEDIVNQMVGHGMWHPGTPR